MKRSVVTMILAATLSASLGVSSLVASDREIVNVPFAFHVQSETMPAGQYQVRQFKGSTNTALFSLIDSHGHTRFINAPLLGNAKPDEPKLTFACYRGDCSLSRIDLPGSTVSHGLPQDKASYRLALAPQVEIPILH